MKKIRVGVIFGGRSGEHEVSLRSAESILKSIDRSKYDVVPIGITHEGRWLASKNAIALLPAKDAIQKTLTTGEAIVFPAEPAARGVVDVVFPILHGTFGEDGTIQGLLELANVPYVGAGVLGSSVGMDKDVMKRLLRDAELPIVAHRVVRRGEWDRGKRRLLETALALGLPSFVKPANLGSSVGVSRATSASELERGIEHAFEFDEKIIVEQGLDHPREIECAVLGNDEPIASIPGEITIEHADGFYSYAAKYIDEKGATIKI